MKKICKIHPKRTQNMYYRNVLVFLKIFDQIHFWREKSGKLLVNFWSKSVGNVREKSKGNLPYKDFFFD